jgi:hypothetical protein
MIADDPRASLKLAAPEDELPYLVENGKYPGGGRLANDFYRVEFELACPKKCPQFLQNSLLWTLRACVFYEMLMPVA